MREIIYENYDRHKKYKFKDRIIENIEQQPEYKEIIIAKKNKEIIAYIIFVKKEDINNHLKGIFLSDIYTNNDNTITDLYVKPKFRKQKIGTNLVNKILEKHKDRIIDCIPEQNAKPFWKKQNIERLRFY